MRDRTDDHWNLPYLDSETTSYFLIPLGYTSFHPGVRECAVFRRNVTGTQAAKTGTRGSIRMLAVAAMLIRPGGKVPRIMAPARRLYYDSPAYNAIENIGRFYVCSFGGKRDSCRSNHAIGDGICARGMSLRGGEDEDSRLASHRSKTNLGACSRRPANEQKWPVPDFESPCKCWRFSRGRAGHIR